MTLAGVGVPIRATYRTKIAGFAVSVSLARTVCHIANVVINKLIHALVTDSVAWMVAARRYWGGVSSCELHMPHVMKSLT